MKANHVASWLGIIGGKLFREKILRRPVFLLLAVGLTLAWVDPVGPGAQRAYMEIGETLGGVEIYGAGLTLDKVWHVIEVGWVAGVRLIVAFVVAWLFSWVIERFVDDRIAKAMHPSADDLLIERAREVVDIISAEGFTTVHSPAKNQPATNHQCTKDLLIKLSTSKTVRCLSIAGYEYFGRGQGGVIYDHLLKLGTAPKLEYIVVDPEAGRETISRRVESLGSHAREENLDTEKICSQIKATLEQVQQYKKRSCESAAYLVSKNPNWRLVLLDDCCFASAYSTAHQGHEGAIFQVKAATGWYLAFEHYFEMMKAGARRWEP